MTGLVSVYTQCRRCSYDYVADLLVRYMKEYHGYDLIKSYFRPAHFYVGDCNTLFGTVSSGVLWCDTPSDVTAERPDHVKVVVPSQWLATRIPNVDGVVPRAVNDSLALKYVNFDFDSRAGYIMVAKNRPYKNVDKVLSLFRGHRSRLVLVSDHPEADFPWFGFPDDLKYYLLSRARFLIAVSDAEGFGLPVVEAMSVGTPVVYLNKHAYSEHASGFVIDRIEDIKNIDVSREEWVDASYRAWYKSLRYFHRVVTQELWGYFPSE